MSDIPEPASSLRREAEALLMKWFGEGVRACWTPTMLTEFTALLKAQRREVWELTVERIAKYELIDVVPVLTKDEERTYKKLVSVMKWAKDSMTKELE